MHLREFVDFFSWKLHLYAVHHVPLPPTTNEHVMFQEEEKNTCSADVCPDVRLQSSICLEPNLLCRQGTPSPSLAWLASRSLTPRERVLVGHYIAHSNGDTYRFTFPCPCSSILRCAFETNSACAEPVQAGVNRRGHVLRFR